MVNPYLMGTLHRIATITHRIPRLSFEGRLIEYHFARANIDRSKRQRILDVGCGGSKLPIELAKLGHEVYGIDVGSYPDQDLFAFVQGDIRQMPFDNSFFDVITAVSTIEHVGLGRYGDPISSNGDKQAVKEIERVLRLGGNLIITIPCGIDTICYSREGVPLHKVYSPSSLVDLLSKFKILEMSYVVKKGRIWLSASVSEAESEARGAKTEKVGMTSVALIVARKEKR